MERLRSLGRGSFGEVFHARDPATGEEVALKVLHSRDPIALDAFKNEARLLYDVVHPALIAPDEVVIDDGSLALVMPYVPGRTFTEVLAEADDERRTRLVVALVRALADLHAHGILHLDLKGANVRVTPDDRIAVLDFGLSRVRDRQGQGLVGTPDTMAPEQLALDTLSPATDLYAVGAMIFEALTGRAAFAGEPPLARLVRDAPPLAANAPWPALVAALLARAPAARPSVSQVLARLGQAHVSASAASFSGRDGELARLDELLAAVRDGASALVTVSGDASVGKTALMHRFALGAAVPIVWARCFPDETPPFGPLDGALDHPATRGDGPVVVIIDDAHHGDAAALELLAAWLERRPASLALVAHRAWAGSTFGAALERRARRGLAFEHVRLTLAPIATSDSRVDLSTLNAEEQHAIALALLEPELAPPSTRAARRVLRACRRLAPVARRALITHVLGDPRAAHAAIAESLSEPALVARHFAAAELPTRARPFALRTEDPDLLALARAVADEPALAERHARALSERGRGREAAAVWCARAQASDGRAARDHLRAAADALLVVGALDEGRALLAPMLARDALDAAERFDTCWPLARALAFVHPHEGFALLHDALAHAHASGDSARVARVSGPLAGFVLGALPDTRALARTWVEAIAQSTHPDRAALAALWSAFLAATRGDPRLSLELGRDALDALACAPAVRWERFQAVSVATRALLDLGHYASLLSLVGAHLVEAERVDDRYMVASLSSYQLVALTARGRVADARALAAWVRTTWLPGHWTAQALYARFAESVMDLYDGDAPAAAQRLASGRPFFEQGGGYRVIFQRLDHDVLEARIGLAHERWPTSLWSYETLVARVAELAIPAGPAHVALLRACHARRHGADARAHLLEAAAAFDAIYVVNEAEVARLRVAQLDGDAGAAAAACAVLRRHGVRDPYRWADVVAPWV